MGTISHFSEKLSNAKNVASTYQNDRNLKELQRIVNRLEVKVERKSILLYIFHEFCNFLLCPFFGFFYYHKQANKQTNVGLFLYHSYFSFLFVCFSV